MQTPPVLQKESAQSGLRKMNELSGPPGVPLLGNLLQIKTEKLHRIIGDWSKEYGPIFKIQLGNMPILAITSPEAIHYVLKNRPDKFRRFSKMDDIIRELGVIGVFNAEGDSWKRQRKLVSQALNVQNLKNFFPVLISITEILFNRWRELSAKGTALEIKSELMRYTVDVTARLAFGYNMNTIEEKEDIIQHHLEIIFPAVFKRMNSPIPYWRFIKLPADRRLDRSLRMINKTLQDIIVNTRDQLAHNPELQNKPSNFLQALLAISDPDDPLSNQEVIGNVLTMLLAGEDTTAHTIAWIFYFMHTHPLVQSKMQEEADLVLGSERMLTSYDNVQKLRYIEAVAYEAMRLKPVSPTLFHDTLVDVVIEGVEVPKGTGLFLQTQYSATREEHFTDAEKFLPERWLEGGCPAGYAHNQNAYLPFGAGSRFCPGYQLAMLEIKAVVAMVCKNFQVTMETSPEQVEELLTFTMKPSDFLVTLVARS